MEIITEVNGQETWYSGLMDAYNRITQPNTERNEEADFRINDLLAVCSAALREYLEKWNPEDIEDDQNNAGFALRLQTKCSLFSVINLSKKPNQITHKSKVGSMREMAFCSIANLLNAAAMQSYNLSSTEQTGAEYNKKYDTEYDPEKKIIIATRKVKGREIYPGSKDFGYFTKPVVPEAQFGNVDHDDFYVVGKSGIEESSTIYKALGILLELQKMRKMPLPDFIAEQIINAYPLIRRMRKEVAVQSVPTPEWQKLGEQMDLGKIPTRDEWKNGTR